MRPQLVGQTAKLCFRLSARVTGAVHLSHADVRLQLDTGFVLEAVRIDGLVLETCLPNLQGRPEVVLEATCNSHRGSAFKHADVLLQLDRGFVLEAVRIDGLVLEHVSPTFRADREVVLEATCNSLWGCALKYADERLKLDRDFMLEAVRVKGATLEHASPTLQADRQVVLEAMQSCDQCKAFSFAHETLKHDTDFVLEVVRVYGPGLGIRLPSSSGRPASGTRGYPQQSQGQCISVCR